MADRASAAGGPACSPDLHAIPATAPFSAPRLSQGPSGRACGLVILVGGHKGAGRTTLAASLAWNAAAAGLDALLLDTGKDGGAVAAEKGTAAGSRTPHRCALARLAKRPRPKASATTRAAAAMVKACDLALLPSVRAAPARRSGRSAARLQRSEQVLRQILQRAEPVVTRGPEGARHDVPFGFLAHWAWRTAR